METFIINEVENTVTVNRFGGHVDTGVIVEYRKHRGQNYRFHQYVIVEFTFPSSDGNFTVREAFKVSKAEKIITPEREWK